MIENKLTIHIFSYGDPRDVNTWSGVPYYIGSGLSENGVKLIYSDFSFPRLSKTYNLAISLINRISKRFCDRVFIQSFNNGLFGCVFTNLYIFFRTIIYAHVDINLFLTFTYGWSSFSNRTVLLCDQTYSEAIARAVLDSKPYAFNKARIQSQSLTLKSAKYIFATTQVTISYLINTYGEFRIHPNPIRFIKIHDSDKDNLVVPIHEDKSIIFVGSDPYYRGLDVLLEAFYILQSEFPKLVLVIIGCGDSELILQYKQYTNNIIHYPYLDKSKEEELALYTKFLKEASLFVMPQRGELLAGAMLESLHFGTPVITTNAKGMNIFIQHDYNGLLLSDSEPYLFAIAIKELLLDVSKLKTMSSNAIKSVQNLSPKNAATELISASLQAIKKKRR